MTNFQNNLFFEFTLTNCIDIIIINLVCLQLDEILGLPKHFNKLKTYFSSKNSIIMKFYFINIQTNK